MVIPPLLCAAAAFAEAASADPGVSLIPMPALSPPLGTKELVSGEHCP